MNKIRFLEWLLLTENQTIAQLLKKTKLEPGYKETRDYIKKRIERHMGPESEKYMDSYINFFFYNFYDELKKSNINNLLLIPSHISSRLANRIDQTIDYLISNSDNNILKSKLNNSQFTIEMLTKESEEWHERIETSKARPAAEAETFIDLDYLGASWNGWRWVLLDKRSCEKEGASAGHCGNAAGKDGDNILSLRDPNNIAYLTFIINNGALGETKGRNNSKPAVKYHPAIIELLRMIN